MLLLLLHSSTQKSKHSVNIKFSVFSFQPKIPRVFGASLHLKESKNNGKQFVMRRSVSNYLKAIIHIA